MKNREAVDNVVSKKNLCEKGIFVLCQPLSGKKSSCSKREVRDYIFFLNIRDNKFYKSICVISRSPVKKYCNRGKG